MGNFPSMCRNRGKNQFNPEKFQLAEMEFEGKISKRVHYSILDPSQPLEGEKILPMY
jgi:hypothetical protein